MIGRPSYEDQGTAPDPDGALFEQVGRRSPERAVSCVRCRRTVSTQGLPGHIRAAHDRGWGR